jgi:hypothetical protein
VTSPTLWDFIPPEPGGEIFDSLVAIAKELAHARGSHGVTVGEVVFEAEEKRGIKVGGAPMEDKVKEQRQTSWLPRIMKAAGLAPLDVTRRSPVKRHHKHRHTVWIVAAIPDQRRASA